MSYDQTIWTRTAGIAFNRVFESEGFTEVDTGQWEFSTKNWIISASLDSVEDEDIPDDVYAGIRGVTHQVALNVMPSTAPDRAKAIARRLARALAEEGQGAVQDLQTDKISLAKSARPPLHTAPRSGDEFISILSLVWCMDHSHIMKREGLDRFLDILLRYLPEALPRRYGPYEPLRFKYSDTGRQHFVATYLSDPGTNIYDQRSA